MLDQNTDRMWYVIGAVIVGAAIILIMNGTMPQLFASVGDTFSDKTEQVTGSVDELSMTDGVGSVKPTSRNLLDIRDVESRFNSGSVPLGWGVTYGYVFQGAPNTEYTLSTDIPTRYVGYEEYEYEYDLFISTPVMNDPSSRHNGVAIDEPRTIVTDDTGEMTIWFRHPSSYIGRTTYFDVFAGEYLVQLEKGDMATEYEPY